MSDKTNIERIIESLSSVEKDELYRCLWLEHVTEDVVSFCEDNDIPYNNEDFPSTVAKRYVYDGEYDCGLSYWVNIENLVKKVRDEV